MGESVKKITEELKDICDKIEEPSDFTEEGEDEYETVKKAFYRLNSMVSDISYTKTFGETELKDICLHIFSEEGKFYCYLGVGKISDGSYTFDMDEQSREFLWNFYEDMLELA